MTPSDDVESTPLDLFGIRTFHMVRDALEDPELNLISVLLPSRFSYETNSINGLSSRAQVQSPPRLQRPMMPSELLPMFQIFQRD
jgi:hypothetical protein